MGRTKIGRVARRLLPGLCLAALSACPGDWPLPVLARQELSLELPPLPASWANADGLEFSLSWRDERGGMKSALARPGSMLAVSVRRGEWQAILAQARWKGRALCPAGALYPQALAPVFAPSLGREVLGLTWRGGYLASLALCLKDCGEDPRAFALESLGLEAERRSLDPWSRPPPEVARELHVASFRIDSFGMGERRELVFPGPGPWLPESPFAPAALPAASGYTAWLGSGIHRFLGRGAELIVSVPEDRGPAIIVELP